MTSAKPRTRAMVYYQAKQWTKKESEMCGEWRELRWNGKEGMKKRSPGRVEEGRGGRLEEERREEERMEGGGKDGEGRMEGERRRGGKMEEDGGGEEERIKKWKREEEEGSKRMAAKGRMGHTGKI